MLRGHVVESMPAERRLALDVSFVGAARRYWLGVFPRVCIERRRRRARALQIPDPLLRATALDAQRKWGNVEGAAAFAAFVPARHRAAAARAMTCFQAAYNYLDMLGEQPCADPVANGRRLHGALLVALDPDAQHLDYYEHCLEREDGGYLREIVDSCREALAALPSYPALAPAALRAAGRIVEFQSCNTGDRSELGRQGDLMALERWGRAHTPPGEDLRWWETAAAGGSSLGVFALLALAAEPGLERSEAASREAIAAVEDAYFPWVGALHSLLDNLVDVAEDRATGQHSLIGLYSSPLAGRRADRPAGRALAASSPVTAGCSRAYAGAGGDGELLPVHAGGRDARGAAGRARGARGAGRPGRSGDAGVPYALACARSAARRVGAGSARGGGRDARKARAARARGSTCARRDARHR